MARPRRRCETVPPSGARRQRAVDPSAMPARSWHRQVPGDRASPRYSPAASLRPPAGCRESRAHRPRRRDRRAPYQQAVVSPRRSSKYTRLGASWIRTRGASLFCHVIAPRTRLRATATSSPESWTLESARVSRPAICTGPRAGSSMPASAPSVASWLALAVKLASMPGRASGLRSAPWNLPWASSISTDASIVHGFFSASSDSSAPSVPWAVNGLPATLPCTATVIGPPWVSAVTSASLSTSGGRVSLCRQRSAAPCARSCQPALRQQTGKCGGVPASRELDVLRVDREHRRRIVTAPQFRQLEIRPFGAHIKTETFGPRGEPPRRRDSRQAAARARSVSNARRRRACRGTETTGPCRRA